MPSTAEVEAAAEAIARFDFDEATLAKTDKPLLQLMADSTRTSFLAKIRAGLEAAERVRATEAHG